MHGSNPRPGADPQEGSGHTPSPAGPRHQPLKRPGVSGKPLSLLFQGYCLETDKEMIPEDPGVFVVYEGQYHPARDQILLQGILYIGEAENLRSRIEGHEKLPEWRRALKPGSRICFSFARVSGPDRERVKAALVHEHKPPENGGADEFPFETTELDCRGDTAYLHPRFVTERADP